MTDGLGEGNNRELLWASVEYPLTYYRCFTVAAYDWPADLDPPIVLSGPELLIADEAALLCVTGATDFFPHVRVERWSAEPPRSTQAWELTGEAVIQHTGDTRLDVLTTTTRAIPLPLGEPGKYRVRAHSRGRKESLRLEATEFHFRGVEHWLLQFWPVDDANAGPRQSADMR